MFRKIVSNLSFSPAIVGQLGFYAKRLRKEETTRRLGLVFVALALVVQSLVVFQPSESANAASTNDFVSGGLGLGANRSLDNFIRPYDANTNNLQDIMNYFGITRGEIAAASYSSWITGEKLSWGFQTRYSYAQGERAVAIPNASGSPVTTVYGHPMKINNGANTRIYGWIGYSQKMGWFAIMQACGNLVTDTTPTPPPPPPPPAPTPVADCSALASKIVSRTRFELNATATSGSGATISSYTFTVKDSAGKVAYTKTVPSTALTASSGQFNLATVGTYSASVAVTTSVGIKTSSACTTKLTVAPPDKCPVNGSITVDDKECQPCPGKDTLWIKDELCSAKIVQSKTALNISQSSVDATTIAARESDQIRYTLTIENTGLLSQSVDLKENLADVLEYATIIDNGGGIYDSTSKTLTWPSITLDKSEKQTRVFAVRLLDKIPATAQGSSDPSSFNCVMTNTFGNQVDINITCPTEKIVETVVNELPTTGPTENMIFAGVILAIATYFYARTRQVKKEVRLIRRSLNTGTI
jgi:hypothetical protein